MITVSRLNLKEELTESSADDSLSLQVAGWCLYYNSDGGDEGRVREELFFNLVVFVGSREGRRASVGQCIRDSYIPYHSSDSPSSIR